MAIVVVHLGCVENTVFESYCECVQGLLPAVHPSLPSGPGRVQTPDGQVHARQGRGLVGEVTTCSSCFPPARLQTQRVRRCQLHRTPESPARGSGRRGARSGACGAVRQARATGLPARRAAPAMGPLEPDLRRERGRQRDGDVAVSVETCEAPTCRGRRPGRRSSVDDRVNARHRGGHAVEQVEALLEAMSAVSERTRP